MRSRLAYYSLLDTLQLQYILRRSPFARFGDPKISFTSLLAAIDLLESAVTIWPRRWVYWYALADYYACAGELSKALHACERCYELRPRDLRSAYALATALRILTRARYVGDGRVEAIRKLTSTISGPPFFYDFNPEASAAALAEVGLTAEEAAKRSIQLFKDVLKRVRGLDAVHVRENIASMYIDFPHLARDLSHNG